MPDVSKVELFGAQDEKLFVEISQKRLAQLGLDFNQVMAQIGQQNAVESAGVDQCRHRLRAGARGRAVQVGRGPASSSPIRAGGSSFRLGDIASIRRAYVDPPQVKVRHQGKEVIALGISMAKGGDIIDMGQALQKATDAIRAELPAGIEMRQFQNQSKVVSRSVNEFVGVLIEAVLIVLAVSFVSLGLHFKPTPGSSRSTGAPGWWWASPSRWCWRSPSSPCTTGASGLHKISLGSLIIALGLLVDDAIIAVEMMVRKLEEGYDKVRAATFAYEATAMPMLTGTLITAAGFLPIGLAKSTVGEYTFAIFAVTAAALLISWLVSVYFVPYLGTVLLKKPPHALAEGEPHELFDTPFYTRFRALVDWCVRHRWITIGADRGHARARRRRHGPGAEPVLPRFEPAGDPGRPVVPGRHLVSRPTRSITKRVEARLMKLDGVDHVHHLGRQRRRALRAGARPDLPAEQRQPAGPDAEDLAGARPHAGGLPELLATEFPEVRGRVKLLPNGPPVPYPVQFRVVGPDPAQVRRSADEVKEMMRANPNLRGVNDNWNESVKVLRLEIDQDKARALGVSSQAIAQAARTITRQHHRPVPRGRQADRHRAAPAAGRAPR